MAAFGGLIITNRGRALQAKAQIGTQLVFTRVAVGDGELGGSSILDLTALKHEVQSLSIMKIKTLSGGKAVVGAILSNQGITQGFYLREIGIFAQDPDLGEILYCYGNAGALAEYIPAGGGPDIVEKNIDIVTIVGNASSVSAVIDESLIFETPDGAQEKADAAESNAKSYADQLVAARVLNAGSTPSIQAGPDASKPAPGTAGRLYVATDTQMIYRDTGSTWQKVGAVKWGDIDGKPSTFSPSAHKSTHATGGADALTPADIGAAAASHTHSGGDITSAVANATNADQVDGYHAGNSSGQVPVSNGTVCTNLNADKVDSIDLRVNNGVLEYNDGSGWKTVGDFFDRAAYGNVDIASTTGATVLSISGKRGRLLGISTSTNSFIDITVTLDGVTVLDTVSFVTGKLPDIPTSGYLIPVNLDFNSSCTVYVYNGSSSTRGKAYAVYKS